MKRGQPPPPSSLQLSVISSPSLPVKFCHGGEADIAVLEQLQHQLRPGALGSLGLQWWKGRVTSLVGLGVLR